MASVTLFPTVSGRAYRTGTESFATMRAGAGTGNDDGSSNTTLFIANMNGAPASSFTALTRGLFTFDTSSLGAGATVTAATFSLCVNSVQNDSDSTAVGLTGVTTVSNPPVNSDYNIANMGSTRFATDIAIASLVTGLTNYNNWALNASGLAAINVTGSTNIAVRNSTDIDNSAPAGGGNRSIEAFFPFQSGTSSDPKLVITYTPAATANGGFLAFM